MTDKKSANRMSEVNIKVIGCGDAFGSGGLSQTCFYIQSGKCSFLIDCGATSISALKKNKVNPVNLDYILISHLHGDHFGGLPFIILDSIQNNRNKVLKIIGPKELEERTWNLFRIQYPGTEKNIRKEWFVFETYTSFKEFVTEDFSVLPFPVIHSEAVYPHGLRVVFGDKIISFSGDTEWCDNLIPLSENADIFICECCFYDSNVKGHLNYKILLENKEKLTCKNIILTHADDELLAKKDQLQLRCAHDGMELAV